jgi:hypothetical protein
VIKAVIDITRLTKTLMFVILGEALQIAKWARSQMSKNIESMLIVALTVKAFYLIERIVIAKISSVLLEVS